MGGQDYGNSALQPPDDLPQFPSGQHVQPQGGLIQEEDTGLGNQAHSDAQPTLPPAGQRLGPAVFRLFHGQGCDDLPAPFPGQLSVAAVQTGYQLQIFLDGEIGRHRRLLRREVQHSFDRLRLLPDALLQQQSIPRRGFGETAQHTDGGGFARAVDPQQGQQLPLLHRQIQSVHGGFILEFFLQIQRLNGGHASASSGFAGCSWA